MAYTPLAPTALDTGLIPSSVRKKYFEEVLLTTDFTRFMGAQPSSVIQIGYQEMGAGATLAIPFSREIDYKNPIIGNFSQISGKGQNIKFYSDNITVERRAQVDKLDSIQFMNLDTPIDIYDALKPMLQKAHRRDIVYSLLKSATIDAYPDFAGGPVTDRVIYSAPSNAPIYNASITTALTAMANNTSAYNSSGLSVAHIRKLRDYAMYGGTTFEKEKRISPADLAMSKGAWVPTYIYLMDTPSYRSLTQDPAWNLYFTRGTIESTLDQPSGLKGAFYKGMIDNVEIYECPELGNFQQAVAGSNFAWNLFVGAQAWYLLWGKQPWFAIERSNMETNIEMAMLEIRGQKPLKFSSFSNEAVSIENGMIHSFINITNL